MNTTTLNSHLNLAYRQHFSLALMVLAKRNLRLVCECTVSHVHRKADQIRYYAHCKKIGRNWVVPGASWRVHPAWSQSTVTARNGDSLATKTRLNDRTP